MVGKSADFVVEAIGTEVGTLGEWGHPWVGVTILGAQGGGQRGGDVEV